MRQVSSFTRHYIYTKCWDLLSKLILCCVVVLLGPQGYTSSSQMTIFTLVLGITFINSNLVVRKYRCVSSDWLGLLLWMSMLLQCLLGVMKADNFQSAFLVASTLSRMMLVINIVTLALWVLLAVLFRYGVKEKWPVIEDDLRLICLNHPPVIEAINRGKRLMEDSRVIPLVLYPRMSLIHAKQELVAALKSVLHPQKPMRRKYAKKSKEWVQANDPYTIKRADKVRLLEHIVQALTVQLSSLYTQIPSRFSMEQLEDETRHWCGLNAGIRGLRESVARKENYRLAMSIPKRALFYKLLAVNSFLGDITPPRPDWDRDLISLEERSIMGNSSAIRGTPAHRRSVSQANGSGGSGSKEMKTPGSGRGRRSAVLPGDRSMLNSQVKRRPSVNMGGRQGVNVATSQLLSELPLLESKHGQGQKPSPTRDRDSTEQTPPRPGKGKLGMTLKARNNALKPSENLEDRVGELNSDQSPLKAVGSRVKTIKRRKSAFNVGIDMEELAKRKAQTEAEAGSVKKFSKNL